MQKKKEIKLVSKNDPQSLKNERSFKIDLLFLNLEFSWGFLEELLFVKATFDVNEGFFWENRYLEDHLRDQCELMHLLLWEEKHSVSKSTTNWKWLFPLTLLFITMSHQKKCSCSKDNSHSACPCTVGRDLHAQRTTQGLLCCDPWNNFCPQTCKSALQWSGSLLSWKISVRTWGNQFTPLV